MGVGKDEYWSDPITQADLTHAGWLIHRPPEKGVWLCTSLSDEFCTRRIHFHDGRTRACKKEGCKACEAGKESRPTGFIAAARHSDGKKFIAQIAWQAVQSFVLQTREYASLRGVQFCFSRTKSKTNGKHLMEAKGISPNAHKLGPSIDPWPILCFIFGIDEEATAGFHEFDRFATTEAQEAAARKKVIETGHDSDWMAARGQDLPGQLVLPIGRMPEVNGASNGRAHK